ncbi:MAG: hypothetical protein WB762_07755, partial [Candidatus Sulfotelmatobacter sp.]
MPSDVVGTLPKFDDPSVRLCGGFSVGGITVELTGYRSADVALIPPLEPFRVKTGASDISVQVEWVAGIAPSGDPRVFDSGSVWRLSKGKDFLQFDFNVPFLGEQPYKRLIVDNNFCRAELKMNEQSFATLPSVPEPLEYPLDELLIMHRLTQERAIELHG